MLGRPREILSHVTFSSYLLCAYEIPQSFRCTISFRRFLSCPHRFDNSTPPLPAQSTFQPGFTPVYQPLPLRYSSLWTTIGRTSPRLLRQHRATQSGTSIRVSDRTVGCLHQEHYAPESLFPWWHNQLKKRSHCCRSTYEQFYTRIPVYWLSPNDAETILPDVRAQLSKTSSSASDHTPRDERGSRMKYNI